MWGVLVKLGSKGSLLVEAGTEEVVRQGIIQAERVVDTTGAGDSLTAGYAVGRLERKSHQEAMRFGAAVASIVVSQALVLWLCWDRLWSGPVRELEQRPCHLTRSPPSQVSRMGAMSSLPTRAEVDALLEADGTQRK